MTRGERKQLGLGLLFISPWVVGLAVFGLYPIAMAVYYSFCNYSVLHEPYFVGTANFREMWADDVFWKALRNTLYYTIFAVPFGLILALILAVLLNNPIPGRSVFRTLFYLPSIVPLVAVAMVWMWVFNGDLGLLNYGLSYLGIQGPTWLGEAAYIKPTLVLSAVWQVGATFVLFLAGLQEVPRSLYESAEIDGANFLHQFWHITVPMISPVIYFNLIIGIIYSIQEFVRPFVMLPTGGADRAGLLYAMYLYQTAFRDMQMGYACAMALIMFAIIVLLTVVVTRAVRSSIYYGGD